MLGLCVYGARNTRSKLTQFDSILPLRNPDEPQGLKVLLMGKPCSGKGTQAPLMGRKYRMVHISTGACVSRSCVYTLALSF